MNTFTHALEVLALAVLFITTVALSVATYLDERDRGFRLYHESEYPHSNVKVIREAEDV